MGAFIIGVLYWLFVLMSTFLIINSIWFVLTDNPAKRLKFIQKANENQCYKLAKRCCCLMLKDGELQEEYVYNVDGKAYYVIYAHTTDTEFDSEKMDNYDAAQLLKRDYDIIKVFYDKKNPKKCMIKEEIFLSNVFLRKIKTNRRDRGRNRYRSITNDWTRYGPIDLREGRNN